MANAQQPVSDLVAQGWEIQGFSTTPGGTEYAHTFLLRRQRQHKVVVVWTKAFGGGVGVKELDI